MQRNTLILIIALVIVAACGLVVTSFFLGPGSASITSVTTDKDLYHSHEVMMITVSLSSQGSMGNATLRLLGLQDEDGHFQLNKDLPVTLSMGPNTLVYEHELPHCSSCSGLLAGTYTIDASLIHNGIVVSNMTRSFQLEQ
jgi:hypothetical protein